MITKRVKNTRLVLLRYTKLVDGIEIIEEITKQVIGKSPLMRTVEGKRYRNHLDSVVQALRNLKSELANDMPFDPFED